MKTIQIFFLLLLNSIVFGQIENPFVIENISVINTADKKTSLDFKNNSANFYEDDDYIVSKSCSGEWGGTIIFKDKRTGYEYECSATCPVIVNKLNGKYYVTNSLAHMVGFTDVLEIENPTLLKRIISTPVKNKNHKPVVISIDEAESKSKAGAKTLVDTIGLLTLISFPYKGQLYHIIEDYSKTYLAIISNNKFENLETFAEHRLWSDDREVTKTKDNHYIVFFDSGYFDIFENMIRIYNYK